MWKVIGIAIIKTWKCIELNGNGVNRDRNINMCFLLKRTEEGCVWPRHRSIYLFFPFTRHWAYNQSLFLGEVIKWMGICRKHMVYRIVHHRGYCNQRNILSSLWIIRKLAHFHWIFWLWCNITYVFARWHKWYLGEHFLKGFLIGEKRQGFLWVTLNHARFPSTNFCCYQFGL